MKVLRKDEVRKIVTIIDMSDDIDLPEGSPDVYVTITDNLKYDFWKRTYRFGLRPAFKAEKAPKEIKEIIEEIEKICPKLS